MKNPTSKVQCPKFSTVVRLWILGFGLLTLLSGCTVGPNYEREKVSVGKNFGEAGKTVSTNSPVSDWWKTFNDPELEKLVGEALRENLNLQIATARIRESRFQRNMAAADLFPNVDADAGYAISRGSENVKLPLGGSSSSSSSGSSSSSSTSHSAVQSKAQSQSQSAGANSSQNSSSSGGSSGNDSAFDNQLTPFGKGGLPGATTELYQAGFDASWEIDVFGGKRRQVEAATAEVEAADESRRDLTVTLLAEVARNYFELRGIQERLEIAKKNLSAQNEILELTRSRAKSGLTSEADVTRAAAETATTAAIIPPLEAGERQLIHALSTLLAQEPNALSDELEKIQPLPPPPPEVPVGLPSELIERRPDIREAERQIVAANARIGSAQADLFPKFALIASAGLDSSSPGNLLDWESRYFLISPTVTWRIFDAGRIISNIQLQKANKQEAALQYRATILNALQEVEDTLVNYATEQKRRNDLTDALEQNKLSLEFARARYEHGLVSFLDVLAAERNVLSAQDALAQSNLAVTTDLVALYKALGGGWK
jgi:NodT family efflux transporter outer membrane factor (OMF) lipoprotein